jgi:hypothetical protein
MLEYYTIRIHRSEVIAPKAQPVAGLGICLNERKDEFKSALKRGAESEMEVFAGWDKDTFFVVNHDKGNEYKVEFQTIENKVYAEKY